MRFSLANRTPPKVFDFHLSTGVLVFLYSNTSGLVTKKCLTNDTLAYNKIVYMIMHTKIKIILSFLNNF